MKRPFWSWEKITKIAHTRLRNTSQIVVGSKIIIEIFWDGEKKFLAGVITKIYSEHKIRSRVKYDVEEIAK